MAKTQRGKRNRTGPYAGSYRRRTEKKNIGRRGRVCKGKGVSK